MAAPLRDKSDLTPEALRCLKHLVSLGVELGGFDFGRTVRSAFAIIWGQETWDNCLKEVANLWDDSVEVAPADAFCLSLDSQLRKDIDDLVRMSQATVGEARDMLQKLRAGHRQTHDTVFQ